MEKAVLTQRQIANLRSGNMWQTGILTSIGHDIYGDAIYTHGTDTPCWFKVHGQRVVFLTEKSESHVRFATLAVARFLIMETNKYIPPKLQSELDKITARLETRNF